MNNIGDSGRIKKVLIYGAPVFFGIAMLGSFLGPEPPLARIGIILVTLAALIPAVWFYRCEKKDRELAVQAQESAANWQYLTAEDCALLGEPPQAKKVDRNWKLIGGSTAVLAIVGFAMIGATSQQVQPTSNSNQGEVFGSCDQARRAGATPLYPNSPGYNPALDNDGDGVACE